MTTPTVTTTRPSLTLEWVSVLLLTVGSVVFPVLGWVVGVVLLWTSKHWTRGDKLLGTFVVPGGLLTPLVLLTVPSSQCVTASGSDIPTVTSCTGFAPPPALAIAGLVLLLAAPVVVAVHLLRRALATAPAA